MQLNAEDGGHRKFIMVQLPEACDPKSEAYKAGYKTICDIGKERIRRAGEKSRRNTRMYNSIRASVSSAWMIHPWRMSITVPAHIRRIR